MKSNQPLGDMTSKLTANDSLSSDYLWTNETLNPSNISSFESEVVLDFELHEIITVCVPFVFALAANLSIAVSIVVNANRTEVTLRRGDKYPVIDLILLILSVTTISRLTVRAGLQILCFSGNY